MLGGLLSTPATGHKIDEAFQIHWVWDLKTMGKPQNHMFQMDQFWDFWTFRTPKSTDFGLVYQGDYSDRNNFMLGI